MSPGTEHEESLDTNTVLARHQIKPEMSQDAEGRPVAGSRLRSHTPGAEPGCCPQGSSHREPAHPLTARAPSQPNAGFQDPRNRRPLEPNRAHHLVADQDGPSDLACWAAEPVPTSAVKVPQPGNPGGRPFVSGCDRFSHLVGRRTCDRCVDQLLQDRLVDIDQSHCWTVGCAHRAQTSNTEARAASRRVQGPDARPHPPRVRASGEDQSRASGQHPGSKPFWLRRLSPSRRREYCGSAKTAGGAPWPRSRPRSR